MFSEINFSLFLPLQNSNVVYLETFCANSVSGDGGTLHRAAFSQNKENLCLFTLCLLPPLQTQYCELEVRLLNIGILEVSRLLVDFFLRPLRPCDPGVAKKWTKYLNIRIVKGVPEILIVLPSLKSKIFGFSHWLLNWPRTSPANFWVHAQRKTAQNCPKRELFLTLLIIHPKLENGPNKCLFHHFGGISTWKSCLRFSIWPNKVPLLGTWTL